MYMLSRGVSAFIRCLMIACYTLFSLKICTDLFATKMTVADFVCFVVIIILLICMALVCTSKLRSKLLFILSIGFILRATVVLLINTQPVSDFETMYSVASEVVSGNFDSFKGTNYLARFPHLTVMTLYMSTVKFIFGKSDIAVMKSINVLLGILNIYLVYSIVLRVHNKKSALIAAALTAVYPAFVAYTGVLCSENIAITFYMVSIIKFYDFVQNKRHVDLMLCAISLSMGNLFRMVSVICLIAYTVYIFFFLKTPLKNKLRNLAVLWSLYVLIIVLVSFALHSMNITQYHLWEGYEPKITNVLKGTNRESIGMWNKKDAELIDSNIYDTITLEKLCKAEIAQRFAKNDILDSVIFYTEKLISQWTSGDCGGTMWATAKLWENSFERGISTYNSFPFQMFLLILYSFSGVCVLNEKSDKITLLQIILIGYFFLLLITENQARYSLIIMWVNIITASITTGNIFDEN